VVEFVCLMYLFVIYVFAQRYTHKSDPLLCSFFKMYILFIIFKKMIVL
jgi:hypothetical protein